MQTTQAAGPVPEVSPPAQLLALREPGTPPHATSSSCFSKYPSLRSLEYQERPLHVPETRIRGSKLRTATMRRARKRLKQESIRLRGLAYDANASGKLEDDWDDRGDWRRGGPEFKLGHVRFLSHDFLGSTSLITNHRGRVLDRLQTGPWGEPLEGNYARARFGYTGHQFEARTGHWATMHRYLDPRAGRWTQRDPMEDVDGQNRYAYAMGRPVAADDPLGLSINIVEDRASERLVIKNALSLLRTYPETAKMMNELGTPCIEVSISIKPSTEQSNPHAAAWTSPFFGGTPPVMQMLDDRTAKSKVTVQGVSTWWAGATR